MNVSSWGTGRKADSDLTSVSFVKHDFVQSKPKSNLTPEQTDSKFIENQYHIF